MSQTYWTKRTTENLFKGLPAIKAYWEELNQYLTDIVEMVRGKISKLVRKTVSPLVVLDKHSLDVVKFKLIANNVEDPNDFEWLSQFRYEWIAGGESARTGKPNSVLCKMINAQRKYAFEYLGNSMRLVVTPLTDRCYRTLMGAIHLDYGGAPAGPAGTGKRRPSKIWEKIAPYSALSTTAPIR